MRKRYRIVVWGTGGVGKACLREAMKLPALDVVGVLVYDERKTLCDIGEIVGLRPYGLKATTDKDVISALKPDCILYTPRDVGDFRADREIIELLKRGHNLITSMAYQNLSVREPAVAASIEEACEVGGSTFCAAGINPGFIVERLAATATGGTTFIKALTVEEFVKIGTEPEETLNAFGFGLPIDESGRKSPAAQIAEQYERQFIYYLGEMFGTPVVELQYSAEWRVADRDVQAATMIVKRNTVAYVSHRWEGVTKDGPRIIFIVYWYMTDDIRPPVPCEDYYRITIEGRPSMRIGIELRASIDEDLRMYPGETTVPAFYVSAATMIQATPHVVAARPGIKVIDPPANSYWKADMRI